tara:strand:+ start:6732 stop:6851 length:120 start_codon:yes stop_codon:yes gene_type:complete
MKDLLGDIIGCLSLFALLYFSLIAADIVAPEQSVWEEQQ